MQPDREDHLSLHIDFGGNKRPGKSHQTKFKWSYSTQSSISLFEQMFVQETLCLSQFAL